MSGKSLPSRSEALISVFDLGGDGPTVAVKDCIDIAGMVTSAGCAALGESAPAAAHADVVRRLVDDGWRVVAKANMHELAYGMTGINHWSGTPLNPMDESRIPGGSSSGSAVAVGAGLVDVAIGTDTGGSIRLPAACCGVIGFKPTYGRVSRIGAHPARSSLDCIGPFARSMDLINRAMASLAPGFSMVQAAKEQGIGKVGVVHVECDALIEQAVRSAAKASGWRLDSVSLPSFSAAFDAGMVLISRETHDAFGYLAGRGQLGDDIETRLFAAGGVTDEAVDEAESVRHQFSREVDAALEGLAALVLPTLPTLPPTLAELRQGGSVLGLSAFVRPFNLSGHPAITIPVPLLLPGSALMAGLQLVGRKGEDETICALALHLERALKQARPD